MQDIGIATSVNRPHWLKYSLSPADIIRPLGGGTGHPFDLVYVWQRPLPILIDNRAEVNAFPDTALVLVGGVLHSLWAGRPSGELSRESCFLPIGGPAGTSLMRRETAGEADSAPNRCQRRGTCIQRFADRLIPISLGDARQAHEELSIISITLFI